ncbi:hypothetical protein BFN03_05135 [Rhodococcus sp. WMMA185]|uniref:hypothetical protein n=1 Tax=Rhodococcus sp. WMMA185 TaxID=679318 RepID=UPI00087844B6|nr:hypothetical protein [Rhodococcus sp. WMMA185]AOW92298.1 hypothetical protein BFN03_05135 [Rhodococcus sp. WMMA185]
MMQPIPRTLYGHDLTFVGISLDECTSCHAQVTHLSAAQAETTSNPYGVAILVAGIVLLISYFLVSSFRLDHRLLAWWGKTRAPDPDVQEARFASLLDAGKPVVTVDPRKYTITVARMNEIANRVGYYYMGERGHAYGSTQVTFEQLPGPPPLRIPSAPEGWRRFLHS